MPGAPPSEASEGDLWFRLSQPREDVRRLDFEDAGLPFNTINQPGPDLGLDALTHREGGLGLWLVRHLSASMRYRRPLDRLLSIAVRNS